MIGMPERRAPRALPRRFRRLRVLVVAGSRAALAVVLLAGGAVAVAGPIAFIGLVVPHMVRFFAGVDYRWIMPYAAITGAIMLVWADVASRLVLSPQEMPLGVTTALVGAPFFIYLARWKVKR